MKTWFTTDCKAWYHRWWYLQWPLWNIQKKRKAIFIQSTVQSISYVRNAQKGLSLKRKNILNLACSSIFILLVHFMFWSISFDVKFSKTHFIKFHYSNISSLSRVFSYKYRREDTISGNHVQNQTWAQDWQLFNLWNKREGSTTFVNRELVIKLVPYANIKHATKKFEMISKGF